MHVMFIHPNFPAQFGHIAFHLTAERGWPSTCVTSIDTKHLKLPFTHINYKIEAGRPHRRCTSTRKRRITPAPDYPGKIESNVRGPIAFISASF